MSVDFTSKKVWNYLIKKTADKILSKRTKGWKMPSIMPIRVKYWYAQAEKVVGSLGWAKQDLGALEHTANVNRQTTDKLLFSYAIITGENV